MKTEFSAGLARVKAETLSGSGRVSQVRSGYDSSNRVKTFSLSKGGQISRVTVAGLSELSSGKVKTSPRASFSLIHQRGQG
jgi:hypothetical protein